MDEDLTFNIFGLNEDDLADLYEDDSDQYAQDEKFRYSDNYDED